MLKVMFFFGKAIGFIEVGRKVSYYTPHIKSCFSKNLHVVWLEEQFMKYPVLVYVLQTNVYLEIIKTT